MDVSKNIDKLSKTFSSDRSFCNMLFSSKVAYGVAKILVYYKWSHFYLPYFQESILEMVPKHFKPQDVKSAEFWTAILIGGIMKDIGLIPYLIIRGIITEAGSILRRGLEHAGVLTHLWYDPPKIGALSDTKSKDFREAFHFEKDKKTHAILKEKGISKRFSNFSSFPEPASRLYQMFSEYNIHGGTPSSILQTSLEPNELSCGFANRDKVKDNKQLSLFSSGIEIICFEITMIQGNFGKKYGVTPSEVGEGARLLGNLLSSQGKPSDDMQHQITSLFSELGVSTNRENNETFF